MNVRQKSTPICKSKGKCKGSPLLLAAEQTVGHGSWVKWVDKCEWVTWVTGQCRKHLAHD